MPLFLGRKLSLRPPDQDRAEVVHVGECGAGDDGVVEVLEEGVAVVVGQGLRQAGAGAAEGGGVDDRAGAVADAVDPVGVAGDRVNAGPAIEFQSQGGEVFHVSSALSISSHSDGRFAAA